MDISEISGIAFLAVLFGGAIAAGLFIPMAEADQDDYKSAHPITDSVAALPVEGSRYPSGHTNPTPTQAP